MTGTKTKSTTKNKPTKLNISVIGKSNITKRNKLIAQACNSPLISSSKIIYVMQGNAEIEVMDVVADLGEQLEFLNGNSNKPMKKY